VFAAPSGISVQLSFVAAGMATATFVSEGGLGHLRHGLWSCNWVVDQRLTAGEGTFSRLVVTSKGSARRRGGDAGFGSLLTVQHALIRVATGLSCWPRTPTKSPTISATLREELYRLSVDEASDKRTIGRFCGNLTCRRW